MTGFTLKDMPMNKVIKMMALACLLAGCGPRAGSTDDVRAIQVAVLEYQFTRNHSGLKDSARVYCVEVTDDKFGTADPAPVVIKQLNARNERVRAGSSCSVNADSLVVERSSGKQGIMFRIGQLTWESATEAAIEGGYYEANLSASGNTYHVKKVNGAWVVTADELSWIS
jgi:hypothetical protein